MFIVYHAFHVNVMLLDWLLMFVHIHVPSCILLFEF